MMLIHYLILHFLLTISQDTEFQKRDYPYKFPQLPMGLVASPLSFLQYTIHIILNDQSQSTLRR